MTEIFTNTHNNELDDLNFGFEYDDISSQDSNDHNNEENTFSNYNSTYNFQKQQKYYDINDILAYNNSNNNHATATNIEYNGAESYPLSSSPGMASFFSPSSANYKLWLQQQVKNE